MPYHRRMETGEFRCTVRVADWSADRAALQHIRHSVFVLEQGVPVEFEWDGVDGQCIHLLAEDDRGEAVGCARLLPDGHVGRMAVRQDWRGRGIGRRLLQAALKAAGAAGFVEVLLNAQTHALGFYEREGFTAHGAVFDDAGIPHRAMRLRLPP